MSLIGSTAAAASTSDSSGTAAASKQKLDEDLNQFLNLLVTQLKNQDPLSPMDANEFTTQLVQFASVEQQIYQNSNLEKLYTLQQSNQVASLVNYMNTTIEYEGKDVNIEDGGGAKIKYQLGSNAKNAYITIKDENGDTVFTQGAETDTDLHTFEWDGKDSQNNQVPAGVYEVWVTGFDGTGELVEVTQTAFGRVTGVSTVDDSPYLIVGDISVKQDTVLSVRETEKTVN
ncbi:MAG: flagellar hook assembly protein FlgD [Magnetospirillum sp. WYHS-4]